MGRVDVVAHPEARIADLEPGVARASRRSSRPRDGVRRPARRAAAGPLLVAGPLEPGAEQAVVVVAGDEHDLAARERLADRLEEGAGAGQRLAERTVAELDRVAEQDEPVASTAANASSNRSRIAGRRSTSQPDGRRGGGRRSGRWSPCAAILATRRRRQADHRKRLTHIAALRVDSPREMESATSTGGPAHPTTNGAGIAVENPATGETLAHVPDLGADDVAALVARRPRRPARAGPRRASRSGRGS